MCVCIHSCGILAYLWITNEELWVMSFLSVLLLYVLYNECPGYDTKQSDGEVPVMLEFWGMRNTLLLPLLSAPLWPVMVAPDKTISMGKIELYVC